MHEEKKFKPYIIKTIAHLKDQKGFERNDEYDGDVVHHNLRVRYFNYYGYDYDYNRLPVDRHEYHDVKFGIVSERIEIISRDYAIKHLYYEEM